MTQDTQTTNGTIWIVDLNDPDSGAALIDGQDARIEVERTDDDEVAIGAVLAGDDQSIASFYMTRAEATLLARKIDAAATPDA